MDVVFAHFLTSLFVCIYIVCGVPESIARLPQNEAAFCNLSWQHCPTEEVLTEATSALCPDATHRGLQLHCREVKVAGDTFRLQLACLPPINCSAGSAPVVTKELRADNVTFASVQCQPCPLGRFEPYSSVSSHYRDQTCRYSHQTCTPDNGKTLVTGGNSTHDNLCRCLTEQEFSPFPHYAECVRDEGFTGLSGCNCRQPPGKWPLRYEAGILNPDKERKASNGSLMFMGIVAVSLLGACLLLYAVKLIYGNRRALGKAASVEMEITVLPPDQETEEAAMLGDDAKCLLQEAIVNGQAPVIQQDV